MARPPISYIAENNSRLIRRGLYHKSKAGKNRFARFLAASGYYVEPEE